MQGRGPRPGADGLQPGPWASRLVAASRRRPLRASIVVLSSIALVLAGRVAAWRPAVAVGEPVADGYTRIRGVVHVHSTLSDGGGTPAEIVAAAQRAGLDFVAITDHNNLDAKPGEGYAGKLLVMVGCELSTTAGHLLALGIPDPVYRFSGDARDGLGDVADLGGASFAAHPTSPREDLRFTGWDLAGAWGLELMNGDSEWRRASFGRLLGLGALYVLNHRYALLSGLTPPTEALSRWDAALAERDVAGIVGADAHSRVPLSKRLAIRFPAYDALFTLASNHLLLAAPLSGDAGRDITTIVEALRGGHGYVGLDALAPAVGFSFVAEAGNRRWTMGDTAPLGADLTLRAAGPMPAGTRLRLLRDGRLQSESTPPLRLRVGSPGVYRVEAIAPGSAVPWVVTNPIYVFDDAVATARARRAASPPPLPTPAPAFVLDDFEGRTIFAPEFDSSSAVELPVIEASDPARGSVGRLAFRLGTPGPGRPYVWCALVNRQPRNLEGRMGLSFRMRADGTYRIWVQVRDENPASADEGTEWWFASVRTSTEWRTVALPFASLRSINPRSDGRLDLAKVRQLVFVLDQGAVKPGTRGTLWLDDVGLF